ncbi:MAG: type II toxin-antitoxin system RelE/ParE family toxin [Pseudomonadota bacterium]
MNIVVHPEAANELNGAIAFYSSRANRELGLALINGFAIVNKFKSVVRLLATNPHLGSQWLADAYRFNMRRFPFNIIYRFGGEQLLILAVAHHRRRPGYWKSR